MSQKDKLDFYRRKMDNYLESQTPLGSNRDLFKTFFTLREHWHKQLTQDPYRTATPRRLFYMVDHGWLHLEWLYVNLPPWVNLFEEQSKQDMHLNSAEWFVLVSAAYLHDCGMVMPDYMEDLFINITDDYTLHFADNTCLITPEAKIIADVARKRGCFTDKEFRKMHPDLGAWWIALTESNKLIPHPELNDLARIIARVVCLHNRDSAEMRRYFLRDEAVVDGAILNIRSGLLAAIIAAADSCLVGREWVDDLADTKEKEYSRIKKIKETKAALDELKEITKTDKPHEKKAEIEAHKKTDNMGKTDNNRLLLLNRQLELCEKLDLLTKQREHYLRHIVIDRICLHGDRLVLIPNYKDYSDTVDTFACKEVRFGEYSQKPCWLIRDVVSEIKEEIEALNNLLETIGNNTADDFISRSALFPTTFYIPPKKEEAELIAKEAADKYLLFNSSEEEKPAIITSVTDCVFRFVDYGTVAPENLEYSNMIYLDVGQDVRTGVLDHHQFKLFQASATKMVVRYPDYVRNAVNPYRKGPLTFVVHREPDLDAVAASTLALEVLLSDPDDAALRLAHYIDLIDSGRQGANQANPFSLYSALEQVKQNVTEKKVTGAISEVQETVDWPVMMENGVKLVKYVLEESRKKELPIEKVDAFNCPHCLSNRDREYMQKDLERYWAKLEDPVTNMQIVPIELPLAIGSYKKIQGLFVRNVQNPRDPKRVMFFKDWARADIKLNPEEGGFSFLCVIEENAMGEKSICWVSVRPNDGIELENLGNILEEAEVKARLKKYGKDSRWFDNKMGKKKEVRPGFNNPDPWYDGRGHDYTIVQTPSEGTVLYADEIEAILFDYGSSSRRVQGKIKLDVFDELDYAAGKDYYQKFKGNREAISKETLNLNYIYRSSSKDHDPDTYRPKEIFISFPQIYRDWVHNNIIGPITNKYGSRKVFSGVKNSATSSSVLQILGQSIKLAKVFIPILCPEYQYSPLCQWEYETAQFSWINYKQPVIIPVLFDETDLPDQIIREILVDTRQNRWQEELLDFIMMQCDEN